MPVASRGVLALTLGAVVTAAGPGCGSFGEAKGGVGADGGTNDGSAPAIVVAKRDLNVVAEWPANGNLDPARDPRLSSIQVTVTDANDGARKAHVGAQREQRGPYAFPRFESSSQVDVVVELRGADQRLLGYGEARRVDVSSATDITVVVRRRFVYAIRGDGSVATDTREVVVLDLAPEAAEGTIEVLGDIVVELGWPTALTLTPDARLLAVAHAATATTGGVAVFETSTHQSQRVVSVPFVPSQMVSIGDGREVLVMPGRFAKTTAMKRVNVVTGETRDAASGLQGGELDVVSAVASVDGKKVAFAGNYRTSSSAPATKPYLLEYDVAAEAAGAPVELVDLKEVTAVRASHDGGEIIVAGWTGVGENQATGKVLTFTGARTMPTTRAIMATNTSRLTTVVAHPSGQRFYVSSADMYPGGGVVGGVFHVYDGAWSQVATYPRQNGPEFDVESAVRLPYAPFLVLGGQSDPGNNVHGPVVALPADGDRPTEVAVTGYVNSGSLVSLATPFGTQL